MPELPEVETIRRGLLCLENKTLRKVIVRRKDLRWPISPELSKLKDRCLYKIERRAKYLLLHVEGGTILVHLGMSGRFFFAEGLSLQKHDHVDFIFDQHVLRFRDPRRFGAVLFTKDHLHHPLLKNLGPEPLGEDFLFEDLQRAAAKSKRAIKLWLMDANVIAGIGNIYANEILFLAKISPLRAPNSLSTSELKKVFSYTREVLQKAVDMGGTTLKDFVNSQGEAGYFQQTLHVYGNAGKPCPKCRKTLLEIKLAGRSTVYCSTCQV